MQERAALMTLSEYQQKVTPIYQAFNKFLRKFGKYFKKDDYYGVKYLTYPEYIEKERERTKAQGYSFMDKDDEYARRNWFGSSTKYDPDRTDEPVPAEVKKQYDDFVAEFSKYFTQDEIERKIERDEIKSNKRAIRRAIDNDFYIDALKDGLVTPTRLVEIFNSVGIKMPKRILELKSKVENEGYDRSKELAQSKKTKEFEDTIRKELGPHYEELRQIEKNRVLKIVEEYENFEKKSGDFYYFLKQYDRFQSYKQYVESILNTLYEGVYVEEGNYKKVYKKIKRKDFDTRVEKIATDFAENFIQLFVARIELKLRVISHKLGIPSFKLSNVKFSNSEFEGLVEATFPNGVKILIEAQVIIAGGYNIQVTHYRYLLKTFYNGKFIDLEDLDALNFIQK